MKRTKQNGITLIALVITIIVLLILAAVSIATLTGENGILTRANDAKEQTEIASEKEQVELAAAAALADARGGEIQQSVLEEELGKYFKAGNYEVTYKVIDSLGAGSTKTITVTVKENGNPQKPDKDNSETNDKTVRESNSQISVQTGDIDDIGTKDFLVGKCTTSYSDDNGVVSFSGTNAFKHVYSLLHINIVNDEAEQSFKMVGCSFLGEGIVTPHVYSFDSASEGMKKSGEDEKSILEIADLSSLTESAITVLLNPVSLETPLGFTLNYTNGEKEYEASVNIGNNFAAGSFSKITLRLVDGKLTMTGNKVEYWNVITLDEIVITGTPK